MKQQSLRTAIAEISEGSSEERSSPKQLGIGASMGSPLRRPVLLDLAASPRQNDADIAADFENIGPQRSQSPRVSMPAYAKKHDNPRSTNQQQTAKVSIPNAQEAKEKDVVQAGGSVASKLYEQQERQADNLQGKDEKSAKAASISGSSPAGASKAAAKENSNPEPSCEGPAVPKQSLQQKRSPCEHPDQPQQKANAGISKYASTGMDSSSQGSRKSQDRKVLAEACSDQNCAAATETSVGEVEPPGLKVHASGSEVVSPALLQEAVQAAMRAHRAAVCADIHSRVVAARAAVIAAIDGDDTALPASQAMGMANAAEQGHDSSRAKVWRKFLEVSCRFESSSRVSNFIVQQ